jgi:RNA polymerase sigma-70 factor, ECF subfamily
MDMSTCSPIFEGFRPLQATPLTLCPALPEIPEPPASGVELTAPESRPPASRITKVNAESSDEVLALAAESGNLRAPGLIMKRYGARVRSKLYRWIGPEDIDDHVQDVFVRLFEQLPRMRDPAALGGFIVGITRRIACSELRRRRRNRMRLTPAGELPEAPPNLVDDGPARQALWRFQSILETLGAKSKRVFVLRYVEKLELTDVAAHMEISVATAKRHLARAAATVSAMVKREPALAQYVASEWCASWCC